MGIWIKSKESIEIDYKKIRKKEEYEPIIANIMNDSKICFPSKYKHIDNQDHKEPDFIDANSGEKFDAKLLFESQLCRALNEDRIEDFLKNLMDFVGFDFLSQRDKGPKDLELYKEMKSRLESLEEDETGLLFLPFPVLMCSPDSFFFDLCSDQFDWCFREMSVKNKVYLIGLNIYGQVVCKQLGGYGITEYLDNKYFDDLISTEVVGWRIEENTQE